jgi:hypothetical protein
LIAESDHGSIIIARFPNYREFSSVVVLIWGIFHEECPISDIGAEAMAWLGRTRLGFGYGLEKYNPKDKVWVLDENDVAIQEDAPNPPPPPPKHRTFVLVIPWWFVSLIALVFMRIVWRKTRPRYAAFPVSLIGPEGNAG